MGRGDLLLLTLGIVQPAKAADPRRSKTPGDRREASRTAPPAATLAHVVRPGQTLWSVAREHGVTVEALVRANRLAPSAQLRVGQRLSIPLAAVVRRAARSLRRSPTSCWIGRRRRRLVRFIRPVPGPIVSAFGPRGVAWHGGMDLRAERHDPIHAAAAGMVISSGWERAYGRVVKIWHPRIS